MPFALLGPLISGTVQTLCMSMLSEKLLLIVVKLLLKKLVDSTDNTLDNELYDQFVIQLENTQKA
jgi:hypothetical protein|tara:strand:- start:276 stop:470 length:195 start_codon:yes stop_codon:yes gene_type:complete